MARRWPNQGSCSCGGYTIRGHKKCLRCRLAPPPRPRYLRCKPNARQLKKGTRIEHREHPEFSMKVAKQIARDHLCSKASYYKKER
jgi:hypothetical protein